MLCHIWRAVPELRARECLCVSERVCVCVRGEQERQKMHCPAGDKCHHGVLVPREVCLICPYVGQDPGSAGKIRGCGRARRCDLFTPDSRGGGKGDCSRE